MIDKTGLQGNFDVDLHWTPDDRADAQPGDGGPSIFSAIQEQLGLRLQSSKGPVEVLVIDRAEQPSDNQKAEDKGPMAVRRIAAHNQPMAVRGHICG